MSTVDKWDQKVYEHYLTRDAAGMKFLAGEQSETIVQAVDYFYKGSKHTPMFEDMDQINNIRSLRRSTRGNIWRSMNAACLVVGQIKENEKTEDKPEQSEQDRKAKIQNALSSEHFVKALGDAQDAEEAVDLVVRGPGSNQEKNAFNAPPADAEIEFRNWLMRQMANDPNVKEIMDCFGAFYAHANAIKREEKFPSVSNIVDAELGNDFDKLFDDEFVKLALPELADLFYLDYVNEELAQYRTEETKPVGKGDVVFLLDRSGSMCSPIPGKDKSYSRMNVAAGFTMAMIKVLEAEGRHATVYSFNDYSSWLGSTKPSGNIDAVTSQELIKAVVQIVEKGATNIKSALGRVLTETQDDVIVISDIEYGESFGQEDWVKIAKGERRLSALIVNDNPDVSLLTGAFDSVMVASGVEDFKKLTQEVI